MSRGKKKKKKKSTERNKTPVQWTIKEQAQMKRLQIGYCEHRQQYFFSWGFERIFESELRLAVIQRIQILGRDRNV